MSKSIDLWSALKLLLEGLRQEDDPFIKDFVIAKASDQDIANEIGDRMNKIDLILNGPS